MRLIIFISLLLLAIPVTSSENQESNAIIKHAIQLNDTKTHSIAKAQATVEESKSKQDTKMKVPVFKTAIYLFVGVLVASFLFLIVYFIVKSVKNRNNERNKLQEAEFKQKAFEIIKESLEKYDIDGQIDKKLEAPLKEFFEKAEKQTTELIQRLDELETEYSNKLSDFDKEKFEIIESISSELSYNTETQEETEKPQKQGKTYKNWFYDAMEYYRNNDNEKAIEALNKSIELRPDFSNGYNNIGICYNSMKKFEEAVEYFDKAIELNPNNSKAYNNRGKNYNDLKKYTDAINDFDQAINLNSNFAKAYNNRGFAKTRLKKYDSAFKDFTKALKLEPNYILAFHNLAEFFLLTGKYGNTLLIVRKAMPITKLPSNQIYLQYLALIARKLQELDTKKDEEKLNDLLNKTNQFSFSLYIANTLMEDSSISSAIKEYINEKTELVKLYQKKTK